MRYRFLAIVAAINMMVCGTASGAWNPSTGLILKGDVVTMTAENAIVPNGRIFVKDEKIVSIVGDGE